MLYQRWNNVEAKQSCATLKNGFIEVVRRCFNVVPTSDNAVVSRLYHAENPASDFVSFSTSDQSYFNVDPQSSNKVYHCWKFDWDWASTTFLYTSQLLQIPCTSSPPTNHLYNTYSRRRIWNQAKHLQRDPFCKYSQPVKTVGYFHREAPSWILEKILNTTLPNNLFPLVHPWFTPMQDSHFLE